MSGGEGMRWIIGTGSKGVGAALGRLVGPPICGLRLALAVCTGVPAEAGSRPGGQGTFFVRTKKVPKESRPASTPLAVQGVPCAARSIGCLRNSPSLTLGAQTVLATAALRASEPDASVLLGVSEGNGKASTINRYSFFTARMWAADWNLGSAVEYMDMPSGFRRVPLWLRTRDKRCAADGFDIGSRRERRTEVSAGGAVRTRCLRRVAPSSRGRPTGDAVVRVARRAANAGRHSLLTFWCCCQKVRRPPGRDPASAARLCLLNPSARKPRTAMLDSMLGQRRHRWSSPARPRMTSHQNHRRRADRGICQCKAIQNRTPPQRRDANIIGGDECSTRS